MITGVVLARNEEKNIIECLQTLHPHVDEILLIDMESEDRTRELATPLVERILPHRLTPNFDAARNLAIDAAQHDWLWFCDADERIPDAVGRIVRDLVRERGEEFEALYVPFKSYFCGKWIEHCGWWPGYTMPRVLKRGHFRFRDQLHGGVEVSGREVKLPPDPAHGVDHYSYASVAHYYEKFNRYTSTESTQLASAGHSWDWRNATRAMVRDLWLYYERNNGRDDDAHGWILSWLAGQYRWSSHAKLIDQNPSPAALASCPPNLDEFMREWLDELTRLRSQEPQLPLGIVWRSPIYDPSGYADDGRCFVKGLANGARQLALEPITWSDKTCKLPDLEVGLFRALESAQRPAHYVAITSCIPTLAMPDPAAVVNVLRTTFETDRVPAEWHSHLDRFDEIWVMSQHNYRAFVSSGVAPEKLRVVPGCLDGSAFEPEGPTLELPMPTQSRFVFLSVFDWQLRKGWDVLLKAYVREFSLDDNTALLLKVSRGHGHPMSLIREQADEVLSQTGTSLAHRPDIVFWDEILESDQMAALYRSVDAFVMPTRGEGWGRTYMEAMACGVPTIGTAASGNIDFMNAENSFLVAAELVEVPESAWREIPPFRGHWWYEPDENQLRQQLRTVFTEADAAQTVAAAASSFIHSNFGLANGKQGVEEAIEQVEARFVNPPQSEPTSDQIRVELQGDLLANHSFSNINETLTEHFGEDDGFAMSMRPRALAPGSLEQTCPRTAKLRPFIDRPLPVGPQVTIRHAYPPDWSDVPTGKWIHIQPWEFAHLPVDWLAPLREKVDEIWAPSNYVKRVYEQSGIPSEKIQVIPWGIDPTIFRPDVPPRHLASEKKFRLLFVGGTITRKGFDLLLDAYLAEFTRADDICLVIKDLGHNTFYRHGNYREQIFAALARPDTPEIVYFDQDMTPGQLASLYTSCDALVAPYRGEGFGLPILEGMACGLAPMVTAGGPSDDFVKDQWGVRLPSQAVPVEHPEQLCGPGLELEVTIADLRRSLRAAYEDPERIRQMGKRAAGHARENYTWQQSTTKMKDRIVFLTDAPTGADAPLPSSKVQGREDEGTEPASVSMIVVTKNAELSIADCLARIVPFAAQVIVADQGSSDRTRAIAAEYRAEFVPVTASDRDSIATQIGTHISQTHIVWLSADDKLSECDWDAIRTAMKGSTIEAISLELAYGGGVTLTQHTGKDRSAADTMFMSEAIRNFQERYQPHLGRRSATFLQMLEHLDCLDVEQVTIVETGCIRMLNDWGAGQSTLIFDEYIARAGGHLTSVDLNAANCAFARSQCPAPGTMVVHDDSIKFLARFAAEHPMTIDLLYLDSYDIDWNAPHDSALHHLQELCAARPALKPGAMVVVDDHQDEQGRPGKSHYVAQYMQTIGARRVFAEYQIGWIV